MELGNYGIGGNEVKLEASEGIADIPQNRTLMVEQLTKDEPVAPEVVTGLTNIDEVFAHFQPEIDIEFSDADGAPVEENFRFNNVGDFSVAKMTEHSPFLSSLNAEKQFADRMENLCVRTRFYNGFWRIPLHVTPLSMHFQSCWTN